MLQQNLLMHNTVQPYGKSEISEQPHFEVNICSLTGLIKFKYGDSSAYFLKVSPRGHSMLLIQTLAYPLLLPAC